MSPARHQPDLIAVEAKVSQHPVIKFGETFARTAYPAPVA